MPPAASIQGTVDAFRAAVGEPDNANQPGQTSGRREINWDGGGANTTTDPVTPFDVFLNIRGARFTTRGKGLTQAPPAGGPQGGLATLFKNPTYGVIFNAFSPLRLFTPVRSNITEGTFFIPGTNGATPAKVTAFGAVFTDVDRQDGGGGTSIEGIAGEHGHRVFCRKWPAPVQGVVPASPGDGSLSFFGIVFDDARIARVLSHDGQRGTRAE